MTTAGATIQIPPEQVRALGAMLTGMGEEAAGVAARLPAAPHVAPVLQAAVEELLDCARAAAHALAGELHWLGATVAAVADSWEGLDAGLIGARGQAVPR